MALDQNESLSEDLSGILSRQHQAHIDTLKQNNRDLIAAIHAAMNYTGSTRSPQRRETLNSARNAFGLATPEQIDDLRLRANQIKGLAQRVGSWNNTAGQTKTGQPQQTPQQAQQPQQTQQAAQQIPQSPGQPPLQWAPQVIPVNSIPGAGPGSGGTQVPPGTPVSGQPSAGSPGASGGPGGPTGGAGAPGGGGRPPSGPYVPPGGGGPPGLVNKMWAGAKSFVPSLGLAENILSEWRSQQDKNNFYRSITGGSHGEAIGERIGEELFRAQTLLSFSEQEARQTYKGITALGYSDRGPEGQPGATREDMMDFVYESKQGFGGTVTESLRRAEIVSRNANISVTGLVDSLEDLSDSAGRAGVNAQQARAQFDSMLESSSAFGSTSRQYALGSVQSQTMLGRSFTNLDPTKQVEDQGYRYMVAASQGMSLAEFNAQSMNNPAAASNAMTGMFLQHMRSYIQGASGEAWNWLEQQVTQQKEALRQDPSRISMQIAEEFWRSHAGTMDPNAFLLMANQFSDRDDFADHLQAMAYLITQMSGMTQGAEQARRQAQVGMTNMGGQSRGQEGLKGRVGERGLAKGEGGVRGGLQTLVEDDTLGIGAGAQSQVTMSYVNQARESGKRSPVLEAMLQQMGTEEEKDQFVEVQTPTGMRVVHLSVAMKHYKNQLMSGQARFVGGEYGGKNVGAFTGGVVDESRAGAAAKEARSKGKWSKKGFTREEWYEKHPEDRPKEDTGWKGASVKIDLTDRAAQMLKPVYEEDASGEPKNNSHFARASRHAAYTPGLGTN